MAVVPHPTGDPEGRLDVAAPARVSPPAGDPRVRAVLDAARDAVLVLDSDGRVVMHNDTAAATFGHAVMTGVDAGELLFFETPSGASRRQPGFLAGLPHANDDGAHAVHGMRADGRVFPVSMSVRHLALDVGEYAVCTVRDESEVVALREQLDLARARFASVATLATIGIVELDADGQLVYANPWLRRAYGLEPDGDGWRSVLDDDERVALVECLRAAADRRDGFDVELRLRTRAGPRWSRVHFTPVLDAQHDLHGWLCVVEDVTQHKAAELRLAHQANHDPLTGLPNRAQLVRDLQHALEDVRIAGRHLGLIFLDLDRFKVLNDSLGHRYGDRVLVEAAMRVRNTIRPDDLVARFGGDEFVVLCKGLERAADLDVITDRIVAAVAMPFDLGGREMRVTASVGIVIAGGDETPEDLLRDADAAMNLAKERGRDRVEVFDAGTRTRSLARMEAEQALREAIEQEALRLVYQPIVEVATGRVVACEALMRWDPPAGMHISVFETVTLAEETGLVLPMGRWVFREACAQLRRWHVEAALSGLRMSVNVSARQLDDPALPAYVAERMAVEGLVPGQLTLEVTESALALDEVGSDDVLAKLADLGVRLAIDDFGMGHSSFTSLRRMPVHAVKVDRSFVMGVAQGGQEASIVAAIIAVADALGLGVIAEGVETEDQLHALRRLGCEWAQGYLFSRPVPAGEAEPLLRAGFAHLV